MIEKKMRVLLWGGGGILCFLFSMVIAVSWGSVQIPFWDVWQAIVAKMFPMVFSMDAGTVGIIWEIRLPRVLLAALVGASLAMAGTVFQGMLQNSLADPYLLGVSSGSAVGAIAAIALGLSASMLSLSAFVGACFALIIVLILAQQNKQLTVNRLILSGVVIQSFFGAVVTFLLSVSYTKVQTMVYWLMGSFSAAQWRDVYVALCVLLVGFLITWAFSRQLNILNLGNRSASLLGVAVTRIRLILLITAALITAVSVSVSGMIGFVGLVIPHIARQFIGNDHRVLVPFSVIFGAIFMLWADYLSRVVLAPMELPIGVVTALTGAPFFAYLLRKGKNDAPG